MKCPNCGTEKVFVGSMASGHLECPVCSEGNAPTIDDKLKGAIGKDYVPFSVRVATERMQKYEAYRDSNSGTCPYCSRLSGHLDPLQCTTLYNQDETHVTQHQLNKGGAAQLAQSAQPKAQGLYSPQPAAQSLVISLRGNPSPWTIPVNSMIDFDGFSFVVIFHDQATHRRDLKIPYAWGDLIVSQVSGDLNSQGKLIAVNIFNPWQVQP